MKFKIIFVVALFIFNSQLIKCAAADDGSKKWFDARNEQAKVKEECSWEENSTQMKSSLASFFDEVINSEDNEKFFKENANLINIQDPFTQETPLIKASKLGKEKAVKAILEVQETDLDLKDKESKTALIHGVLIGNVNIVARLLVRGAKLDCQDSKGFSAIMHAIQKQYKPVIKLLLHYKPHMTLKTKYEPAFDANDLAVVSEDPEIIAMVSSVE